MDEKLTMKHGRVSGGRRYSVVFSPPPSPPPAHYVIKIRYGGKKSAKKGEKGVKADSVSISDSNKCM